MVRLKKVDKIHQILLSGLKILAHRCSQRSKRSKCINNLIIRPDMAETFPMVTHTITAHIMQRT